MPNRERRGRDLNTLEPVAFPAEFFKEQKAMFGSDLRHVLIQSLEDRLFVAYPAREQTNQLLSFGIVVRLLLPGLWAAAWNWGNWGGAWMGGCSVSSKGRRRVGRETWHGSKLTEEGTGRTEWVDNTISLPIGILGCLAHQQGWGTMI